MMLVSKERSLQGQCFVKVGEVSHMGKFSGQRSLSFTVSLEHGKLLLFLSLLLREKKERMVMEQVFIADGL